MSLFHFSVSQVRAAATCPRIHYFDAQLAKQLQMQAPRSTLVWIPGSKASVAGGAAFHRAVERFNRKAATAPEVLQGIEQAQGEVELKQFLLRYLNENCIDLERFSRYSVALRRAFVSALHGYFDELATIINYAVSNRITPARTVEQLFGDRRRRVDVTFRVGDGQQAHVSGDIDYVFYDWRIAGHRIIDYKLTPYDHANRDLFQVCLYALMHHVQHATSPGVALFYLHPTRRTLEMSWQRVHAERTKVHNLISSMVSWNAYDEERGAGLKPPGDVTWCRACKWNRNGECERRLGPKSEGHWDNRWEELGADGRVGEPAAFPSAVAREAPAAASEESLELDDEEVESLDREPDDEETSVAFLGHPEPMQGPCTVDVPVDAMQDPPAPKPRGGSGRSHPESTPCEESSVQPARARIAPFGSKLHLGFLQNGQAVELDPNLIATHMAVVGAAGSGKTWTAKVIAEEVVSAGVPVIAVDPQGDLVQFLRLRNSEHLDEEASERQNLYRDRVEPRIFTPGTSHGTRLTLNPIRLASEEELGRITDPGRRREERETVLQSVASNLVSLAAVKGEEDAQRTFLYLLLSALPKGARPGLRDIVAGIMEPDALGIDEPDQIIKKSDREKLARKLNSFVLGPSKNLFCDGFELNLEELLRPSQPGKVPLNVIYLNALIDDNQKHFFLAALASEIYRWMVTSLDATSGKPNLLFYLDEARDFIPAGGRKPAAKEPLIRLFTQGRKYGVGCLLCTQSPRSVDYNVFGNCSTKIVGRMEAAQDLERIADWFSLSGPAPPWIAERKGAAKGTFVGRWPGISASEEGKTFEGRVLHSVHEGAWSPDRVEREVAADCT